MSARAGAAAAGWQLTPGVRRLRDGRLLGGSPMRIIRLGKAGENALDAILGRLDHPPASSPEGQLTEKLQSYGFVVAPAPPVGPVADITVVIPARTTVAGIVPLLESLPDISVVLVDDGSTVPLKDQLPVREGVSHLRHDTPRGPSAARNAGAKLAATSWLAFIDADVVLNPKALQQLAFDVSRSRGLVAIGPRILNGHSPGLAGVMETYAGALDLGTAASDVGPRARVSYLSTALLLVERAAFEQVGGFDPTLKVAEDVDLVWRLAALGRVRYQASVVVRHGPRTNARDVLRRRHFYGTGAALLEQRHPGAIRHADVSVWTLVPWALAVAVHPLLGLATAAIVVSLAPRRLPNLPPADARRLVLTADAAGWQALGRWLIRPLWPLTLLLGIALPSRRTVVFAACLIGLSEVSATAWRGDAQSDLPARSPRVVLAALTGRTLVDLAYSVGVWQGCLRRRRFAPLLPRVRVTGSKALIQKVATSKVATSKVRA